MPFLLLIVEPIAQRGTRTDAEGREVYDRMLRWRAGLKERGLLLSGESLKSPNDAARVAVRNGRPQVLDGPFAEAKEMIGGFFLVDVATREEAVALAAECPAAEWCTVEVRRLGPCWE